MTAFDTAAGGDRWRMPSSAPVGVGRALRRSPRVGPPGTAANTAPLAPSAPFGPFVNPAQTPLTDPPPQERGVAPRVNRGGRPVSTATPLPPPPVRRDPVRHTIDWTPDLVNWLYSSRASGVPVAVLARTIGCSTQTIFTQFHRDPRGIPGATAPGTAPARMTPREFARRGQGMAEDMPAEILAQEFARPRRVFPPVGPLTRLTPRPRIGRPLDFSDDH